MTSENPTYAIGESYRVVQAFTAFEREYRVNAILDAAVMSPWSPDAARVALLQSLFKTGKISLLVPAAVAPVASTPAAVDEKVIDAAVEKAVYAALHPAVPAA